MKVTIAGKEFEVAPQPADFWRWVAEGRYDGEWKLLKENLRAEHTFVDLGAWVGSHSLYASTIARRVVAVEPDPVAYKILTENLGGRQYVETFRVAIGKHGDVTLGSALLGASTTRLNPNAGAGMAAWEEGQSFEICSFTLREFVAMMGITDPMFIKMDIEGSEENVVTDLDFFKEHRPTVFLELHPFWWRNEETASNIYKLAGLYGAAAVGNHLILK